MDKKALVQNDVIASIGFSGVLTAVTAFFTTVMIDKYREYGHVADIPILFLVISTFGFLYSTLIYANSSGMIIKLHTEKPEKPKVSIEMGNIISEYFGVYFLVLSIPLIINVVVRENLFLQSAVAIVDLGGLFIYHKSGFSIMQRHFEKVNKNLHFLLLSIIILFETILIYQQINIVDKPQILPYLDNIFIFDVTASMLMIFIFLVAFFAPRKSLLDDD